MQFIRQPWLPVLQTGAQLGFNSSLGQNAKAAPFLKSAYHRLKNMSGIKGLTPQQDLEDLVHAFYVQRSLNIATASFPVSLKSPLGSCN